LVPFGMIDDGQKDFEDPHPVSTRGNDINWLL